MARVDSKVHFYALIRKLRKACPPAYPVAVRTRPLQKYNGLCFLKTPKGGGRRQFCITIDSKLENEAKILVLIHEWAHALAWNHLDDEIEKEDHDGAFGVAYARAYSVYDEWASS